MSLTEHGQVRNIDAATRPSKPGENVKEFPVTFLGSFTAEQNWTHSKLSYVLDEIKKRGHSVEVKLEIIGSVVKGIETKSKNVLFAHHLQSMSRFAQTAQDRCLFTYLTTHNHQDQSSTSQTCYLFLADNETTVQELFTTMRESTKEVQLLSTIGQIPPRRDSSASLTSLSLNNTPLTPYNHHFEVMYVGKIKVSHCKAPPTFIDEALEKFRQHELEKVRIRAAQNRKRHGSGSFIGLSNLNTSNNRSERSISVRENDLRRQINAMTSAESTDDLIGSSDLTGLLDPWSSGVCEGVEIKGRARADSGDAVKMRTLSASDFGGSIGRRQRSETVGGASGEQNRTMLFQIGAIELSLISLDKKSVILHKYFKDISHCSQGIKHTDHYGFICRDGSNADGYVGYVFKCQSQSVTDEIMGALKQAFITAAQGHRQQSPVSKGQHCESCPILWLCRLHAEIDGLGSNKIRSILSRHLHELTDTEQDEIKAKFEGAESVNVESENEILLMLLRALCETKQIKHVHTGDLIYKADLSLLEKKHNTSVFDDLKKKAKRSLTSSFENILKVQRKPRDDVRDVFHERSPTHDFDNLSVNESINRRGNRKENLSDCVDSGSADVTPRLRPRSSTVGSTNDYRREKVSSLGNATRFKHSPMMNIFIKVGNQSKSPTASEGNSPTPVRKLSWRQTIFHRVVSPQNTENSSSKTSSIAASGEDGRRSPGSLRNLWKKAIMDQILLIRMEKENRKLKASQDASLSKRMKLDYEEITPCLKEVTRVWDDMLATPGRPDVRFDRQKIVEAVKAGIPRHKRGEIWQLLSEQKLNCKPSDVGVEMSYEDLSRQLTSHQHAILIDLGRTFPHHPYFALPFGPGQLSLFNLLKAYSLLDKEVGYCQGLSFVAGVLLLHMEENLAFEMLKHLLFQQGIRFQYKPDMVALQIQMYQLSRLIHDTYSDLYQHFEAQEIAPTLYAAPWFLTMFASQFPLGFVARVFDLLFLDGIEVVFKVALVLLGNHRELIMQCSTFESVMEFLKTTLPSLGIIQMERVFNQVFTMDISRQLDTYEVEYHVLQEEMFTTPLRSSSADSETVQRLETTNWTLKRENSELQDQLEAAHATIHNLESLMSTYQTNISHLETRVRELELDRLSLKKSVESLRHRIPEIDCSDQVLECSGIESSPMSSRRARSRSDDVDAEVTHLTSTMSFSNGAAKFLRGRHASGESSLSLTNSPILE